MIADVSSSTPAHTCLLACANKAMTLSEFHAVVVNAGVQEENDGVSLSGTGVTAGFQ